MADAGKKIRWVAQAVGLADSGDALADKVERDIAIVQKRWAASSKRMDPKAVFLYLPGPKTQLLGGAGTRAHATLSAAGAVDAGAYLAGVSGYVPITSEALVRAKPDTIVVLENGLASVGGIDGLLKIPGIALTPAGQKRRVLAFDDLKLLASRMEHPTTHCALRPCRTPTAAESESSSTHSTRAPCSSFLPPITHNITDLRYAPKVAAQPHTSSHLENNNEHVQHVAKPSNIRQHQRFRWIGKFRGCGRTARSTRPAPRRRF